MRRPDTSGKVVPGACGSHWKCSIAKCWSASGRHGKSRRTGRSQVAASIHFSIHFCCVIMEWFSVMLNGYSLTAFVPCDPLPFPFGHICFVVLVMRKEGRAVEVVPGIYAVQGSFPCPQLPRPVHTAWLSWVFLCVFSLGLCFVCLFVIFDLFVCPHSFMFPWAVESIKTQWSILPRILNLILTLTLKITIIYLYNCLTCSGNSVFLWRHV